MTETALTRNTRTLDLLGLLSPVDSIPTSHHAAVFGQEGAAELNLNIDTWRRMGEPELITVTIEPGNTLNVVPAWSSCSNPACTAAHTRNHPLVVTSCSGCEAP